MELEEIPPTRCLERIRRNMIQPCSEVREQYSNVGIRGECIIAEYKSYWDKFHQPVHFYTWHYVKSMSVTPNADVAQAPLVDRGQGFNLGSFSEAAAEPLVIKKKSLSVLSITEIASSWQLFKKLLRKKEKVVL